MIIHRVADLRGEDAAENIVKDADGNVVLDNRDRRLVRYRVRYTLMDDDGKKHYRTRRFDRLDRDSAEEFRVQLLQSSRSHVDVDEGGFALPALPAARSTAVSQTIDDLIAEYLVTREFASTSNKSSFKTNLDLLSHILRELVDGILVLDPEKKRRSLRVDEVTPDLMRQALTIRRHTDLKLRARILKEVARYDRWVTYMTGDRPPGRPPAKVTACPSLALDTNVKVSARTEHMFAIVANALFEYATGFGRIDTNPWTPVAKYARHASVTFIEASTVPSKSDVWRMADVMAKQTGSWEMATLLKLWFVTALRPEEFFALRGTDFHLDGDEPYVRVIRAEVIVSAPNNISPTDKEASEDKLPRNVERRGLKHRPPGAHRDVDIPFGDLIQDLRLLISRLPKRSSRLLSTPSGQPIDRDNWRKHTFNPARDEALGGSEVDQIRNLVPRRLRHAGITWRLSKGIDVKTVADRVGNSPQVLLTHYASAIPQATRRDLELMEADEPDVGLQAVGSVRTA